MVRLTCLVEGCAKANPKKDADVGYHQMPKDKKRFRVWAEAAGFPDLRPDADNKYVICSRHFEETAFRLRDRLLKLPQHRWKLDESAEPTLNLPMSRQKSLAEKRKAALEAVNRKSLVEDLLKQHEEEVIAEKFKEAATQTAAGSVAVPEDKQQVRIMVLEKQLDSLSWIVGRQQAQIFKLKQLLRASVGNGETGGGEGTIVHEDIIEGEEQEVYELDGQPETVDLVFEDYETVEGDEDDDASQDYYEETLEEEVIEEDV